MRVVSCVLNNFASYERLEFNFVNQGLTLVQGPTGAGKSTLCDAIPWCLFGRTAKNGAVDEVRSWQSDKPTVGMIEVQLELYGVYITRIRGASKDNDLYYAFTAEPGVKIRGKDLADTQRLIDGLLGFDCDLYLSAAYYHEFSETAQFFQTTAKNRRAICEQLVDLSLAMSLRFKISESTKTATKELADIDKRAAARSVEKLFYEEQVQIEQSKAEEWKEDNAKEVREVTEKYKHFDEAKRTAVRELARQAALFKKQKNAEVRAINEEILLNKAGIKTEEYLQFEEENLQQRLQLAGGEVCAACGGPKNSTEHDAIHKRQGELRAEKMLSDALMRGLVKLEDRLEHARTTINPYLAQMDAESARENTYGEQLKTLKLAANPHKLTVKQHLMQVHEKADELKALKEQQDAVSLKIDDLDVLSDVIDAYRSTTIQHTIQEIEHKTNDLLTRFFDAEIRVVFTAGDADKIEVEINKDGNACSFTQLSKGQRQLLKLCFGVAVMKTVAEKQAVKFEQIFLDEFLDGLDENFKAKAFRLLESLALDYDSVFVVEHSESFKAMFSNSYKVSLVDGKSQIEQA